VYRARLINGHKMADLMSVHPTNNGSRGTRSSNGALLLRTFKLNFDLHYLKNFIYVIFCLYTLHRFMRFLSYSASILLLVCLRPPLVWCQYLNYARPNIGDSFISRTLPDDDTLVYNCGVPIIVILTQVIQVENCCAD
jgi:hypothetical protein